MQGERIVVTRAIPFIEEAVKEFPQGWQVEVNPSKQPWPEETFLEKIKDASGILVVGDRLDERRLAWAEQLKVVSNYGVGVDNIDLNVAERHGVIVTNLPDEVTYSTAELAMALILACCRRIPEADRTIRTTNPFPWNTSYFMGTNLEGKTLGLIGFGRIGQRTARLAKAFGMEIVYYNRTRKPEAEKELSAQYLPLQELLAESDVVSLHVPGGEDTFHLLGEDEFELMKPGAILVNTARGTVIDEEALVEALQNKLFAAGLDVHENEPAIHPRLTELGNVVLTPHIGTSTKEARLQMTRGAVHNLIAALTGQELSSRVV